MQRDWALADAEIVRVFGYFALIVGVGCLVLFAANVRSRYLFGASDFSYLGYMAVYALIGGWATVGLRKWGAVMLALPLCVAGIVLAALAIWKQRTVVGAIIATGWLAILSCPAMFAFRAWHHLK